MKHHFHCAHFNNTVFQQYFVEIGSAEYYSNLFKSVETTGIIAFGPEFSVACTASVVYFAQTSQGTCSVSPICHITHQHLNS